MQMMIKTITVQYSIFSFSDTLLSCQNLTMLEKAITDRGRVDCCSQHALSSSLRVHRNGRFTVEHELHCRVYMSSKYTVKPHLIPPYTTHNTALENWILKFSEFSEIQTQNQNQRSWCKN